jgi:hypothetical protein
VGGGKTLIGNTLNLKLKNKKHVKKFDTTENCTRRMYERDKSDYQAVQAAGSDGRTS